MNKKMIQKIMETDKRLAEVLNEKLDRGKLEEFFQCMVLIGEAKCGGKTKLAKSAKLSRQTVYNAMKSSNITLNTCNALLKVIGFRFHVKAK